jgi:hypothetical protein
MIGKITDATLTIPRLCRASGGRRNFAWRPRANMNQPYATSYIGYEFRHFTGCQLGERNPIAAGANCCS